VRGYFARPESAIVKSLPIVLIVQPYQGMESRSDFYFRGMYLRLIRTLDFLASQPEWDGKRILVIGESQGGGQALAAAGLDKELVPW